MMIKYIGKTYTLQVWNWALIQLTLTKSFGSLMNRTCITPKNALKCLTQGGKLLLEASYSSKDLMHAWVLVSFRVFLI